MKRLTIAMAVAILASVVSTSLAGPEILSYQGYVVGPGGAPVADNLYDMRFTLYDSPTGGVARWTEIDTSVSIQNGLLSTTLGDGLPLGPVLGAYSNLWLEVAIDLDGNHVFGPTEVYSPRQCMTSAAWAVSADRLSGLTASAFQRRVTGVAPPGQYISAIKADGAVVTSADEAGWSLMGNTGLTLDTHFLGTIGPVPLDLRTNGTRALRLEPTAETPNLIGGYWGNSVASGAVGATIGGGGGADDGWGEPIPNLVTDDYGTVGGGGLNQAGDNAGTPSEASYATVGGGRRNIASGYAATVVGGTSNTASGDYATVGGYRNRAIGSGSAIGGGYWNTASDWYVAIGGGAWNEATSFAATVGGGGANTASGLYAAVGGGGLNTASGILATVGGGEDNASSAPYAVVMGGYSNLAAGYAASVGGGYSNTASQDYTTVGGGLWNAASDGYATVGGGRSNTASGLYATASGGVLNTASGPTATVGGGEGNVSNASYAAIVGGYLNFAGAYAAAVGGGYSNIASDDCATVGGGSGNIASGPKAIVGGGYANEASGPYATVPGGYYNLAAGAHSFAAGQAARARHSGTFVWGDGTPANINSATNNQFAVRANGGIWLGRATVATSATIPAGRFIHTTTGAYLSDGGVWTDSSDRNQKEGFAAVDGQWVLDRLSRLPISTFSYKAEDRSVRHMGAVAQDFYATFGLGQDDLHIAPLDANGVALVSIQALHKLVQEKDARIADLEARLAAVENRLNNGQR